jgi:DNA mismatch endonuclease (patch repair protein)
LFHKAKTPAPSSATASQRLKQVRQRDTDCELAVRKVLHRRGFRYFVDRRAEPDIKVRADMLFPRTKLAIFIDGCFWHGCPEHRTLPRSNTDWWTNKFSQNRARDEQGTAALTNRGWTVLRFWAHEDPELVVDLIKSTIARLKS